MRKVFVSLLLLRLVISPICCLFSQFQWIVYDVYPLIYHPDVCIAQEYLWINCQIELSKALYDGSVMI